MLGSGVFVTLFGMGYLWDIHRFSYYALVSVSVLLPYLVCLFTSCLTLAHGMGYFWDIHTVQLLRLCGCCELSRACCLDIVVSGVFWDGLFVGRAHVQLLRPCICPDDCSLWYTCVMRNKTGSLDFKDQHVLSISVNELSSWS